MRYIKSFLKGMIIATVIRVFSERIVWHFEQLEKCSENDKEALTHGSAELLLLLEELWTVDLIIHK